MLSRIYFQLTSKAFIEMCVTELDTNIQVKIICMMLV